MMDKLISQQAAIDTIKKRLFETAFNNVGIKQNIDETLVDVAENRLESWFDEMPSVQSEPEVISKWKKEFREYVDSLDIARDDWKGIVEYIDELPSAQPDIIHCKDCEYLCNEDGLRGMCWHINGFGTDVKDKYNSFCSWAKRRKVTE